MCALIIKKNKVDIGTSPKTKTYFIDGKVYTVNADQLHLFNAHTVDLLKRRAKKLNVPFTLTEQQLREWWLTTSDRCAYCNCSVEEYLFIKNFLLNYNGGDYEILRFKRCFNTHTQKQINNLTKDRIDPPSGYIITNLCKACWICNCLRGTFFSAEEWKKIAPLVVVPLRKLLQG